MRFTGLPIRRSSYLFSQSYRAIEAKPEQYCSMASPPSGNISPEGRPHSRFAHGVISMTNKPAAAQDDKKPKDAHPGMMGDGTEEQNLDQPGNPDVRIKKGEVDAAFAKQAPKK
jgi:hypothetical protein